MPHSPLPLIPRGGPTFSIPCLYESVHESNRITIFITKYLSTTNRKFLFLKFWHPNYKLLIVLHVESNINGSTDPLMKKKYFKREKRANNKQEYSATS